MRDLTACRINVDTCSRKIDMHI